MDSECLLIRGGNAEGLERLGAGDDISSIFYMHGCVKQEVVFGSQGRVNQSSPGKDEVVCRNRCTVRPGDAVSQVECIVQAVFRDFPAFRHVRLDNAVRVKFGQTGDAECLHDERVAVSRILVIHRIQVGIDSYDNRCLLLCVICRRRCGRAGTGT